MHEYVMFCFEIVVLDMTRHVLWTLPFHLLHHPSRKNILLLLNYLSLPLSHKIRTITAANAVSHYWAPW